MDFENILDDLYTQFNQCRMRPQQFVNKFEGMRSSYQGNIFKNSIQTRQGPKALENLIQDLNKRSPTGKRLKWSFALHMAADELANILGPNGIYTTQGTKMHRTLPERVKDYAIVKGRLSQIYEFGGRTSNQIIEQLLIDDGLSSRKRRNTLLDPIYNYVGIGSSYHQSDEACTVIILAEDIVSLVAPDASGKYKKRVMETGKKSAVQLTQKIVLDSLGNLLPQLINPTSLISNTQNNPQVQPNPIPVQPSSDNNASFILNDSPSRPQSNLNDPKGGERGTYINNLGNLSPSAGQSVTYNNSLANQSQNLNNLNPSGGQSVTYNSGINTGANQSGTYANNWGPSSGQSVTYNSNAQANQSGAYGNANSLSPAAGQSVNYGTNVQANQSGAYGNVNNLNPSAGQSVTYNSGANQSGTYANNLGPSSGESVTYNSNLQANQSGVYGTNNLNPSAGQSVTYNSNINQNVNQTNNSLSPSAGQSVSYTNQANNLPGSQVANNTNQSISSSQIQEQQYNLYKQENPTISVNPPPNSTNSLNTVQPGTVGTTTTPPKSEGSKCSVM